MITTSFGEKMFCLVAITFTFPKVREVTFLPPGGGSWNWIEIHKNELSPPQQMSLNFLFPPLRKKKISCPPSPPPPPPQTSPSFYSINQCSTKKVKMKSTNFIELQEVPFLPPPRSNFCKKLQAAVEGSKCNWP